MTQLDLAQLSSYTTAKQVPKNTVIIKEGDKMPFSMYIVLKGSVRIVKNYEKVNQGTVSILQPGNFFGEMSLFLSKPRTATAITAEPSTILEITQANVNDVFSKHPGMLHTVIRTLCTRIEEQNERLTSINRI